MFNLKKKILTQVALHSAAIMIFIISEMGTVIFTGNKANLHLAALFYSFDISYFYFNSRWYLPKLIRQHRSRAVNVLCSLLEIAIYTGILCLITFILRLFLKKDDPFLHVDDFVSGLWRSFFIWSISTGYWFARYSIKKVKELADSKERESRLENDFIRSQVNPHFLLNTLTFIYYKLIPTNSDIAKTVAMLSEMMQYSVRNNAENAKVSLADDLAQINRYLEIQQTLNGHQLCLTFKTLFTADEKNVFLPPLIFLNFIENIFKYGQLKDQDHPAFIFINYDGKILHFHSENFVLPSNQVQSNFLGIANTKARLDKHFDQKYLLQTDLNNGIYEVDLKIIL